MFQLIVAVISIALIAALAIASIFYGGDAFTKSSEKANVTTLINQGQQIAGAAALYKTDNATNPADMAALTTGTTTYLAQAPAGNKVADGWVVDGANGYAYVPFTTAAAADDATKIAFCEEVTKQKVGNCYTGTAYGVADNTATAAGFAIPL